MTVGDGFTHQGLSELVLQYGCLLDERRFEEWLGLFAEELRYRLIMRKNSERGEPFYLINEDRVRLMQRIEAYCEQPQEPSLRLISNVVAHSAKPDRAEVSAAALILRNGRIAFAGSYRFDCVKLGRDWKISEVLFIIEGESTPEIIQLPV
jgi:3-phenylpropionate/cinnamic acid dioxygenase small subunit